MPVLESEFQGPLWKALNKAGRGTRVWRQNAGRWEAVTRTRGGRYRRWRGQLLTYWVHGAPAGAADLTGVARPEGWRLEVETKGEKTEERAAQDRWRDFIERDGGIYVRLRYDASLTMKENVARGVEKVDAAIGRRRRER